MLYQVRKGYTWIGPDGKPTGADTVMDTDPGFANQRHKLEPIRVATAKSEVPGAKDRMIDDDEVERR